MAFWGFDRSTWALLVLLALVPTVLGHGMANFAVRYVRLHLINIMILVEPVLTLLWAFLIWRLAPGPWEAGGGFLILIGGALAIDEERRRQSRNRS